MSLQHTTLLAFVVLLASACASTPKQESNSTSRSNSGTTSIDQLGANIRTLEIKGTLTTTGEQSFDGMPFSASLDENDRFLLTMSGPFGITAAKMVATPDTFTMVNYLLQEVWDGHPQAPGLKTATHLPIEAGALMSLMRGRAPGGDVPFADPTTRDDGSTLYKRSDTSGVEYLLVDEENGVIRQFQRKSATGEKQLDVAFSDVRTVSGIPLPHKIFVSANDGESTATVKIEEAEANIPITRSFKLQAPSSFSRKTYSR